MRIVSLLPSATEIVAALGLGRALVGRTHECDFPAWVSEVPAVTADRLECAPLDSAGIDRAVSEAVSTEGLYRLDERALAAARPDLIVTQALCGVCAVEVDRVREAAERLPGRPQVLSLEPETIEDVLESIVTVGAAAGAHRAAERLRARLAERIAAVAARAAGRPRPRVTCLEWLDPPFAAGHWVPEQVALAGGHDPLGRPGRPSVRIAPAQVVEADPELLVLMPCGWSADQAAAALDPAAFAGAYGATRAVRDGRVVAVDASAYFSRPGPRLVDGAELLAALIHPEADGPYPAGAARWLVPAAA
jgi:iron complex transport system substrate-binding protein